MVAAQQQINMQRNLAIQHLQMNTNPTWRLRQTDLPEVLLPGYHIRPIVEERAMQQGLPSLHSSFAMGNASTLPKLPEGDRICQFCEYYNDADEECHINPPTKNGWPEVCIGDSCAQFAESQKNLNKRRDAQKRLDDANKKDIEAFDRRIRRSSAYCDIGDNISRNKVAFDVLNSDFKNFRKEVRSVQKTVGWFILGLTVAVIGLSIFLGVYL
jgi:hypothetical protein